MRLHMEVLRERLEVILFGVLYGNPLGILHGVPLWIFRWTCSMESSMDILYGILYGNHYESPWGIALWVSLRNLWEIPK